MGITIHYKGKAKSFESIDALIEQLQKTSEKFGWDHGLVEEEIKGELCPSWGYGFGYIPNKEEVEKQNIEYFPAMVTKDCNGYFKLWDSRYQEVYRQAFNKGIWPTFSVDAKTKGIWLDIHPDCETLEFVFDLASLELANYQRHDRTPHLVHYYEGLFCKTQFAGVKAHIAVCKIIELTENYVEYSSIYDEAGFYGTDDIEKATEAFSESSVQIRAFSETLKEIFKGEGLEIISGYKL